MRIRDYSGGAYGSRRGRRINCERSFRCVDCGKLRYLTRGELSRAARPHCLDCGGCLEETAASRQRQEISDERIERQNTVIRCRICGIGFIDEDSLAHHLRENRDCAREYQKLLAEEKNRKPSLFSIEDEPMADGTMIKETISYVVGKEIGGHRDDDGLSLSDKLDQCFTDRAKILAYIANPQDVLHRVVRLTRRSGKTVFPILEKFLRQELNKLDAATNDLLGQNFVPSEKSFDVEYKDHDGKIQKTQVSAKSKLHAAAIVRNTLASLVLKCTLTGE